jgi:hypothetical protein
MSTINFGLYHAALAADDAYTAALKKAYPGSPEPHNRYAGNHQALEVLAAISDKYMADEAWIENVRLSREVQS